MHTQPPIQNPIFNAQTKPTNQRMNEHTHTHVRTQPNAFPADTTETHANPLWATTKYILMTRISCLLLFISFYIQLQCIDNGSYREWIQWFKISKKTNETKHSHSFSVSKCTISILFVIFNFPFVCISLKKKTWLINFAVRVIDSIWFDLISVWYYQS